MTVAGIVLCSIVIPTCNRPEQLLICLEKLAVQMADASGVELLVCDDGRDAPAGDLLAERFPKFQYVEGPKRGPAANRNAGARKAVGEWLLFVDDDCVPQRGFLEAYLQEMRSGVGPMVAITGPTIRPCNPPSLLWEAPHNPDGKFLISCNFATRARDFQAAGEFDERYPLAAFEDTEFAERFRLLGGQVQFVPKAVVGHPLRPLPSAAKLAARWEGRAIYALDQGAEPAQVVVGLPWHVLRVIQSRFRNQPLSRANFVAMSRFIREWLLVCWWTPRWIRQQMKRGRCEFWAQHVAAHGPVPRFGF